MPCGSKRLKFTKKSKKICNNTLTFSAEYSIILGLCAGMAKSADARDFDSLTRGFESRLPSQRPLGGGCDPLAQLAEHLTFNQGVRGSNLRWITSKFPLKSLFLAILGDFLCPYSTGAFLRILRYFTLLYDKMYTKMYTIPYQSFTK